MEASFLRDKKSMLVCVSEGGREGGRVREVGRDEGSGRERKGGREGRSERKGGRGREREEGMEGGGAGERRGL